jgi:CheY-like chemotaxis protein
LPLRPSVRADSKSFAKRLHAKNPHDTLELMELDTNLTPWIEQLEAAFKPYPEFVDRVGASLQEISDTQNALFEALANADLENTRLNQLMAVESGDFESAEVEENEKKFQSFVVEIASLKSHLEALKIRLEEQIDAGKQAQIQLTEKDHLIEEAQAQIRSMHESQLDASALLETHARDLAYAQEEIRALNSALIEARASTRDHPEALLSGERQPRARTSSPRNTQIKGPTLPDRKVLLVDDAEINRVLMSHYFKGLPVKLHFAISVTAALQKFKENQYDLVVVDDELQDLDHSELIQNSQKLVALSNGGNGLSLKHPEIRHVLNRGQSREDFVDQLKSYLWTA